MFYIIHNCFVCEGETVLHNNSPRDNEGILPCYGIWEINQLCNNNKETCLFYVKS